VHAGLSGRWYLAPGGLAPPPGYGRNHLPGSPSREPHGGLPVSQHERAPDPARKDRPASLQDGLWGCQGRPASDAACRSSPPASSTAGYWPTPAPAATYDYATAPVGVLDRAPRIRVALDYAAEHADQIRERIDATGPRTSGAVRRQGSAPPSGRDRVRRRRDVPGSRGRAPAHQAWPRCRAGLDPGPLGQGPPRSVARSSLAAAD
jgi:hypothetical protein